MSEQLPELIKNIVAASDSDISEAVTNNILSQEIHDVALLLESIPHEQRISIWEEIPQEKKLEILVEMRADAREPLIEQIDASEWDTLFADVVLSLIHI